MPASSFGFSGDLCLPASDSIIARTERGPSGAVRVGVVSGRGHGRWSVAVSGDRRDGSGSDRGAIKLSSSWVSNVADERFEVGGFEIGADFAREPCVRLSSQN